MLAFFRRRVLHPVCASLVGPPEEEGGGRASAVRSAPLRCGNAASAAQPPRSAYRLVHVLTEEFVNHTQEAEQ